MSVNRDKLVNTLMEMPEIEVSTSLHDRILKSVHNIKCVARLGVTVGEVYVQEKDTECWELALPGDAVFEGDTISTRMNSRTCLDFKDGTQIWLNQNTQLVLSASTRKLTMPEGEILAFVQKIKDKGRRFILQTPASRVEVLGTIFDATVLSDRSCTLSVLKGRVRLSTNKGTVKIRSHMESVAEEHCAPTPPVKLDLSKKIQWTSVLVDKSEQQKHLNPAVLRDPRILISTDSPSILIALLAWFGSGILGFILGWLIGILTR